MPDSGATSAASRPSVCARALSQANGLFFSSSRAVGSASKIRAHTRITCIACAQGDR